MMDTKMTTSERARLRAERQAAYDAAGSVRAYAAAQGISYGTAHKLLTSVGVTLAPVGVRTGYRKPAAE